MSSLAPALINPRPCRLRGGRSSGKAGAPEAKATLLKAVAAPAPVLRVGRSIHLLDVENLNRGPSGDYRSVATMWKDTVRPEPGDLIVCATDVSGIFAVRDAFPSVRQLIGRGTDGADRAIGAALTESWIVGRFDTVIVGSGDGYFVPHLHRLRHLGLHTVVVGRSGGTATELRSVAHKVFELR